MINFQHQPIEQFRVESESSSAVYTVSHYADSFVNTGCASMPDWRCSCIGWTRHMPRRDCKHIAWVKAYGPQPGRVKTLPQGLQLGRAT